MAMSLQDFLSTVGPEFKGQAQAVGDAVGSHDLEEIVEYINDRSDLSDLEQAGFKKLHINKLYKAVLQEQERRAGGPPAAAPKPALVFEPAQREVPRPAPAAPQRAVVEAAPLAEEAVGGRKVEGFPKLEKGMSTVPEDTVKEPKAEVVVSDRRKHVGLGSLAEGATTSAADEFPALGQAHKPGARVSVPQQADFVNAQMERAAKLAQLAAEAAQVAAVEVTAQGLAVEAANASVAGSVLRQKARAGGSAMELRGSDWRCAVQLMWPRDEGALVEIDESLIGPLLGKWGVNKQRIEARSRAKLVVVDSKPGDRKMVQILGTWARREEARRLIDRSLNEACAGRVFYQVVSLDPLADRKGICYSKGKSHGQDIDWSAVARWNTKVQGTEDGEFLKLDPWYLPMKVNGKPVLQRKGETTWTLDNSQLRSDKRGIEYMYLDGMLTGYTAKWGDNIKGKDDGDGWFKVEETWYLQMAQKGKHELRKYEPKVGSWSFQEDAQREHISQLSEEDLRARVEQAIDEGVGVVKEVLIYEPAPKFQYASPHAVVLLASEEMADSLRARQSLQILGLLVKTLRPDCDRVRRALSSRGSEAPSEGGSVAGSQNSHTSVQSLSGEGHMMTLLVLGLPVDVTNSDSRKPAAKMAIQDFAGSILGDAKISQDTYTCSASFTVPKKAPHGGCWLNFRYTVENCRVGEDGKSYTLEKFKKLHEGSIDGTDKVLMQKWLKCRDSVQVLEKKLAGDDAPRISIAKWFMDKVKAKYPPTQVSASSQLQTLLPCPGIKGTFPDEKLSLQWKRAGY